VLKPFSRVLTFVLILASVGALHAWSNDPASAQAPDDSLPTLLDKWKRSKAAGDAHLLEGFLEQSFVGVGPTGRAEDRKEFVTRLANPGLKVNESSTRDVSLRLHGKTAVVTGVHQIAGTLDEKDISGRYRFVEVWTKPAERWVLIASTMSKVQE
jgi:hypothetical protein